MTKPMFSEDGERRPLMTEEELHDACTHAAATIVVAFVLGCEFKDCMLDDDGYSWPTSISRVELNYPKDWAREEALSGVAAIHEAGAMAIAKRHGRGPHRINEGKADKLLKDPRIWQAIEAMAQLIERYDGSPGLYGAIGTALAEWDNGEDSAAITLLKSMDLPPLAFA